MNERYDPDILLAYVEGELAPHEAEALERELAADERLRRLVEQLREDRDALRELPTESPPRDLLADATQQLERDMLIGPAPERTPAPAGGREGLGRRVHWGRTLTYGALAAMVVLSAGIILVAVSDTTLLQQADQYARTQAPPQDPPRTDRAAAAADEEAPIIAEDSPTAAEADDPPPEPARDALAALAEGDLYDAPAAPQADVDVGAGVDADTDAATVAAAPSAGAVSAGEAAIVAQLDPAAPTALRAPPRTESARRWEAEAHDPAPAQATALARVPAATEAALDEPTFRAAPAEGRAEVPAQPVRVDVATRSAARTQRDLIEWVQANDASMTLDERGLTLRVRVDQLDDLLVHLRRAPGTQRAALAVGPRETGLAPADARAMRGRRVADTPPRDSLAELADELQASGPVQARVAGDPSVIEREATQHEATQHEAPLTLGRLWSQRDRLLRSFNDALAAHQLQRELIAAHQPPPRIDDAWLAALDWRQRLATQLTPEAPTPTLELAVVIEAVTAPE